MSNKVSEASRLFRFEMEPWAFSKVKNQAEVLSKVAKLKIHQLLPEIPLNWIGEGIFFSTRELAFDTMLFGEIAFGFFIDSLNSKVWRQLTNIVLDDLADRVFQLYTESSLWPKSPYKMFLNSTSPKEAMKYLMNRSPDFKAEMADEGSREAQEVFLIRNFILGKLIREGRLGELKNRRERNGESKKPLGKIVEVHLDFIYKLGSAECSRVTAIRNEGIKCKKVLDSSIPLIDSQENEEARSEEQEILNFQFSAKELGFEVPLELARRIVVSKTKKGEASWFHTGVRTTATLASRVLPYILPMLNDEAKSAVRRYQSILGGLREVSQSQTETMHKQRILGDQLRQIKAELETVAADQRRIAELLPLLSAETQRNHNEVMLSLAIITEEVVLSRAAVFTMLDRGGTACRHIRAQLRHYRGYNVVLNRFISYAAFVNFYKRELLYMEIGLKELPLAISFSKSNNVVLSEATLFSHYFNELLNFYLANLEYDEEKAFEFLLASPQNVESLEHYVETFHKKEKSVLPEWMREHFQKPLKPILSTLYDVAVLIDYAKSVRTLHYFYEMLENLPGGPLLPISRLGEHSHNVTGIELLQNIFIKLEIAVAQLNLLAGNGILPALYSSFRKGKSLDLLAANSILAKNFLIFAFRKRLKEKKRRLTDYYFPYKMSENPQYLQRILGEDWNFRWDKDKELWGIEFAKGKRLTFLPTPVEVITGSLEIHPQIPELHIIRKHILRELAGYQKMDFEKEPIKLEHYGLVLTSLFFRQVQSPMERSAL